VCGAKLSNEDAVWGRQDGAGAILLDGMSFATSTVGVSGGTRREAPNSSQLKHVILWSVAT
jgi:hypothetical protein